MSPKMARTHNLPSSIERVRCGRHGHGRCSRIPIWGIEREISITGAPPKFLVNPKISSGDINRSSVLARRKRRIERSTPETDLSRSADNGHVVIATLPSLLRPFEIFVEASNTPSG